MADNQEGFYDPTPEKRGPGRPRKVAEPAADVAVGISADVSLVTEEAETIEQAIERIRKIRKPFDSAMSQKLALAPRINYHRHWFNDVAGRIDEATNSGWSYVKNPRDGTPLKRVVGTGRDNGVLWAYAMELPEVFWQEEMDARHRQAKDKVDAIKAKVAVARQGQAQASDQGKFYNPHEDRGVDPIQVVKG